MKLMTTVGLLRNQQSFTKCISCCFNSSFVSPRHAVKIPGHGATVVMAEDEVSLKLQSPALRNPLLLHPTWLRDHCRCHDCYDEATNNKLVDISAVGLNVRPKSVGVSSEHLHITWPDGHRSVYGLDWLEDNVYQGYKDRSRASKTLWTRPLDSITIQDTVVKCNDYLNSDKSLRVLLQAVVNRGFGIIRDVPQTTDVIAELAERICPLRLGFFGKIHPFRHHMLHRQHDDAFREKMIPHVDQTYLTEPAGLKMVHCHKTNGKATVELVDGYQVAQQLNSQNAAAYNTLATVPVVSEYVDDMFHHKTCDVILKHDHFSGNLMQVRYNTYYRTALSMLPLPETERFYAALCAFTSLVQNNETRCRVHLVPGSVLVLDNWRILSSISQSDGTVQLSGCYLGWSDYMCRARRLNVTP